MWLFDEFYVNFDLDGINLVNCMIFVYLCSGGVVLVIIYGVYVVLFVCICLIDLMFVGYFLVVIGGVV